VSRVGRRDLRLSYHQSGHRLTRPPHGIHEVFSDTTGKMTEWTDRGLRIRAEAAGLVLTILHAPTAAMDRPIRRHAELAAQGVMEVW
jgi:hypothetical protein